MNTHLPRVLLIGSTDREEFRDVASMLRAHADLQLGATLSEAIACLLSNHKMPRLIILAQSWPGEHNDFEYRELCCLAPLVPVTMLLGGWSEGEPRTGNPLPGAIRIYWHQWLVRGPSLLKSLSNDHCGPLSLAMTTEETHRWQLGGPQACDPSAGFVLVATERREQAAAIVDALRSHNVAAVWTRGGDKPLAAGAVAAICDCPLGSRRLEPIVQLRAQYAHLPILALMDFPRGDQREEAIAAGVAEVLARPLRIEDLVGMIRTLGMKQADQAEAA